MSSVLVGEAYWLASLRFEQFTQGVSAIEQQLARLRASAKDPITFPSPTFGGGSGGAGAGPGAPRQLPGPTLPDVQKDEAAMLRYASSLSAAQKAQGDLA